ncbi:hypothetical protein RQP46_006069 [Phenoliferia psychrophenolica]
MATEGGFPPLTCSDVLACRFSSWYPSFRKHSPKASIIKPLEERFIAYLESDRVFIPEGSGPMGVSELSDDEDADDDDAGSDDSDEDEMAQITFTDLDAQIRRVITKYDGAVFPKLNWSSPQDAAWMLPGSTLKCQSPADVYLLLKSSDFISHDLDHAFDSCVDYSPPQPHSIPPSSSTTSTSPPNEEDLARAANGLQLDDEDDDAGSRSQPPNARGYDFELVLKKWFEMPRAQEWRCFVRDRKLIALCQRDSNYYEFLQGPEAALEIRSKVSAFFEDEVVNVFPLSSYTFDVYFTRSNSRLFLIDFNPYAPQTDALLFSWDALNAIGTDAESIDLENVRGLPLLELVTSSTMASQSLPSYSHNRYPKDVVDLSSGASIAEL